MDVATTTALIDSAVADIGSVLAGGFTAIIGLAALLIGLFFLWKLILKVVGRGK